MARRFVVFLLVVFAGLVFLHVRTLIATEIPDDISIENKGYNSDRRGPVSFSHLNHAEDYDISCMDCHHEYRNGKNVWKEDDPVKGCAECHSPSESRDDVKKLSIAFHKNCKGCHRKLAKEGITKDAPYRKCTDCHERNS